MTHFWQTKTLAEMTPEEWESLCDGCAKCCLTKLEHEHTGDIVYTAVACRLLDEEKCRCTDYEHRTKLVSDCLRLEPANAADFHWLPDTCAYRLLAEGKPLPEWHHLVCGDPDAVHRQGMSVKGRVISEEHVHPDDIENYIITWVD